MGACEIQLFTPHFSLLSDGIIKQDRQLPELCPSPIDLMKLNSLLQDIKQVSRMNIWSPKNWMQNHQA